MGLPHRALALAVLALSTTGCAATFNNDYRHWEESRFSSTEGIIDGHWVSDGNRPHHPVANGLWPYAGFLAILNYQGNTACGPSDEACAARLRSAPFHAEDWQNVYPPP